jgi:quaternary ammonium compound-resistance protein SugE
MPWVVLFLAGLFEICWAVGLKYSNGFSNLGWTLFTVVTLGASMILLANALRFLPVGTAYAVWTGIGAVGTAILGMVLFGEPKTAARFFFIGLVVVGIFGLRAVTRE